LRYNVTGTSNTAVGYNALAGASTNSHSYNTAVGTQALYLNTTANNNTAVGYTSLYSNTTGTGGASFGEQTLSGNTSGSYNTAFGARALISNVTGNALTAVGYQAGYLQNVAGDAYSTFVGYQAGYQITTGVANVCVGYQTGKVITTGIRSVYIGFNNNASGTAATDEILISTTAGTTGKGSTTGFISPGGGGVYQGNNSLSWTQTSDRRIKKNIVDNNTGLEKIAAIQVRNFEYRLPEEVDAELKPSDAIAKSGVQLGVIAQELQQVLPECVKTETTGVMSVNPDNLTWYMVNAIKELSAKVQALEAQLNQGA
jgi:hypothetical protein